MELKCSLCKTTYEFIYIKGEPLPPNFPFCSKRCKSIDLGKWLNEEYCISTPLPEMEKLTEIERKILTEFQDLTEFQKETLARLLGNEVETE